MMKKLLLVPTLILCSLLATAQPAGEKLFKEMILNLPNYTDKPGTDYTLEFTQFTVGKPTAWPIEYGNNPAQDKNTKVYRVVASFNLLTETYNTQSLKKYSSTTKKYRRPYNFYIDRSKNWVCVPVGLSSGYF